MWLKHCKLKNEVSGTSDKEAGDSNNPEGDKSNNEEENDGVLDVE